MRHPLRPSVPVSVGLDYCETAVRICVLDPSGVQRLNRDLSNDAAAIAPGPETVKLCAQPPGAAGRLGKVRRRL